MLSNLQRECLQALVIDIVKQLKKAGIVADSVYWRTIPVAELIDEMRQLDRKKRA